MSANNEVIQAIEAAIGTSIKSCAKKMTQTASENILESKEAHETRIGYQLSQYMLYAKKRCVDGFCCCFDVVKELAQTDPQIDIGSLESNVRSGLSRFDTVAALHQMSQQVQTGTAWKELLGITDDSLQLLYRGAKQLVDVGLHPEAEAAFFFLTTVDFKQYAFWLGLGHAAFHLGNINQAINAYEMANSCKPDSFWPHIYAANCFEALNDYHEALESLERADKNYQSVADSDPQLAQLLQERIAKAKLRIH